MPFQDTAKDQVDGVSSGVHLTDEKIVMAMGKMTQYVTILGGPVRKWE